MSLIESILTLQEFEQDPEDWDPGQKRPCPKHEWNYTGVQYGGDDESYHGEGRCYCVLCGADGKFYPIAGGANG